MLNHNATSFCEGASGRTVAAPVVMTSPTFMALSYIGNMRTHVHGKRIQNVPLAAVLDLRQLSGNEDPAHPGERPDLKDKVLVPDVLLQAHSSTMQIVFYDADAFPAEYRGDAFATMRGSWNREDRTGYKVVRVRIKDGKPTGVYQDFMTGFVLDKDTVWGRPTGIAVAPDGALLVSDDANGTIFRVAHGGSR